MYSRSNKAGSTMARRAEAASTLEALQDELDERTQQLVGPHACVSCRAAAGLCRSLPLPCSIVQHHFTHVKLPP